MGHGPMDMYSAQQAARQRVAETFERGRATSPATARPLGQLGRMDEQVLAACVAEGSVREGAPGTFYLYARPQVHVPALSRAPFSWGRFARVLSFWIIVIMIPIVFVFFSNR